MVSKSCEIKDVQILLSTYNGHKYLKDQLDSYLLMEDIGRCKLLVRDDGSTDDTLDILNSYSDKLDIEIICGENIGYNKSFHELLVHSDPDCRYFAFSDQDDYWLPNKISLALSVLDGEDGSKPTVFCARSKAVDGDLKDIDAKPPRPRSASFYNALIENIISGHTQVFNRALAELLISDDWSCTVCYDWWVYLTACAYGTVLLCDEFTVLYRQHTGNSIGVRVDPVKHFFDRVKRLFSRDKKGVLIGQIVSFIVQHSDSMLDEHLKEARAFVDSQNSFAKRLGYAIKHKAFRQTRFDSLCFSILYLFGAYKA